MYIIYMKIIYVQIIYTYLHIYIYTHTDFIYVFSFNIYSDNVYSGYICIYLDNIHIIMFGVFILLVFFCFTIPLGGERIFISGNVIICIF